MLGAVLVVAVTGLEPFGHYPGPYGDVLAKVVPGERHTGQLVAATTFDYRGFDTLGEEMILFAAACGCAALLRVLRRDRDDEEGAPARPVPSFAARALGAALVGPVLVLGAYIIAHGHLTPGGGFSGGVVVAGALLLAYAAGHGVRLRRLRLDRPCSKRSRRSAPRASWPLALGGLIAAGALLDELPGARDVGDAALGGDDPGGQRRGGHRGGGRRGLDPLRVPRAGAAGGTRVSVLAYLVAVWLFVVGVYGVITSRHLVHLVMCLSVAQASTYVLLLGIGYRKGGQAPIFGDIPTSTPVVDPVVQALTLTDVVVGATVSALLLALAVQAHKRFGSVDPDELNALRG